MSKFAIAAGDPVTAEAAATALCAGGGAVDAVIAGALAACVAEPVLASLLGGGFMMVRDADGRGHLCDFFVQTPKRKVSAAEMDFRAVEADFGETSQVFQIGAAAIAAPGVAAGLAEAHARFARIPFPELAAPAVKAAKDGVLLTDYQASVLQIVKPIFTATPDALAVFGDGETLLGPGDLYRNVPLADVIETYAHEGPRFMQEGEVASALLSLEGGHLTAADLKGFAVKWRQPLVETRGAARILLNPAPSLGGTLIAFALRLIDQGATPSEIAWAFAATSRARLAVDLNRQPAAGAARLLAPDLVDTYRREIAAQKVAVQGTTHISVIDGSGVGAAITLSNGAGSRLIAPGTGLTPNNMLGEEDLIPGDWHEWTQDTRLSSMMAPTAIEWPDGDLAMIGSGGSNRIRTAIAQVAARVIDGRARLEDAVAAPRIHVEGAESKVDFEDRLAEGDCADLLAAYPEAQGWGRESMFFGGVHAVRRDAKGGFEAAGDRRRAGVAVTS